MDDEVYMQLAITLAKQGTGFVSPNPLVGAVIVKDNKIIGQGWHERFGGLHAERNALQNCQEDPDGATIYITLEPCCHYGKTPPCTDALIQSGVRKAVIGCQDPNPLVSGKGIGILRAAGIEVVTGILKAECETLNQIFSHYIKTGKPFVMMKYAMTLDGKIATVSGASGDNGWITGEAARERVHQDRKRFRAIMVGVGTVIADDPLLTCRLPDETAVNPVRIICDTELRIPLESQIVRTASQIRTIIATADLGSDKHSLLATCGCELITVSRKDGHVDLKELVSELGRQTIDSVILEGGADLNASALKQGLVNKLQAYIAPKIFGGESAKTPVGGQGIRLISESVKLNYQRMEQIGKDILIEAEVVS